MTIMPPPKRLSQCLQSVSNPASFASHCPSERVVSLLQSHTTPQALPTGCWLKSAGGREESVISKEFEPGSDDRVAILCFTVWFSAPYNVCALQHSGFAHCIRKQREICSLVNFIICSTWGISSRKYKVEAQITRELYFCEEGFTGQYFQKQQKSTEMQLRALHLPNCNMLQQVQVES